MAMGLLFALVAGTLVSVQNVFNSKVNEWAGRWATTTLVLGMGFAASFLMGLLFEGGKLLQPKPMEPWFWFSGLIGVGVVTCLVQGIKLLGPTYAVAVVLTAQLGFALLWDSFGWLGLDRVPFTLQQLVGVLVIVGGIVVFKLGGEHSAEKKMEAFE
ncbi:DMT family transporter [Domibacillus sp. PGB-M46]|uniref:DMT family transporter n=1 Tax=Domibacillus sp. PGB-M46 TaxID=2910255 RepID=UPI001F584032|nr:DMT family transporter [Domibacillus sp. PGB-M46]MCI2255834.1 DMT family transporter [Domibacillus sp. PGB-M46]